jgi:alpha-galactosidase
LSDEEKTEVTKQIESFKAYGPLIHNGDYYRLTDPMTGKVAVWSYVSGDKSKALVHGVIFRTEPNMIRYTVKLKGLDPAATYIMPETGQTFTGAALMSGGILLPKPWGDFVPVEIYLEKR